MHVTENVSLTAYSTMGLGGTAAYVTDIHDAAEIAEAVAWARGKGVPTRMIGGGSNIFWQDEGFPGLVLVNKITGYDARDDHGDVLLSVGSGELWDSVVERSVEAGLTGIEALSLVPGSAGATPIQNVGAYGQEIAQTLVHVRAYDTHEAKDVVLPAAECRFSYRDSRFKSGPDRGRFYITGLTLRLRRGNPAPPFYRVLEQYLAEHAITDYTPQVIREAVIAIRTSKLPDPAKVRNNGSFFANPIIPKTDFRKLEQTFDDIPHWPARQGVKLSAAWLIVQAGFNEYHDAETGMATWPAQPLVLVNESARSTQDLLRFKQKIVDAVQAKFGITLRQEPELLP
jgi:UDP-N-acetylmuramate dehydrogenase